MTKKIYAIMMKKMVKVKNPARVLQNPTNFFKPCAGFFPHISIWGKNPAEFYKKINIKNSSKNKYV